MRIHADTSGDTGEAEVPFASRLAARLERAGVPLFVALSLLYWATTWQLASRKLMWNDELYTYYMAKLPSMSDVWAALMSRGEQTPPFFYLVTRASISLFGDNHISIRLPAMLAVWVMSACLFVIVRRRTSTLAALCAAAFPLVTTAYPYAFEARAYGLMLGFSALALLSWQTAAMGGRWRRAAIVSLAVSVSLTLSSHYYGVFVLVPIALGEMVRTLERRRLDAPVWVALLVSVTPLLWYLDLIRAGADYTGAFWSPPQWVNLPDFYSELLAPALLPAAALLIVGTVVAAVQRNTPRELVERMALTPPAHEVAAALGFALIPAVCLVVAKVATGAFVNRYALTAVVGFAVLAGFGSALWFRRQPAMRLLAVACVAGWFVLSQARELVNPTGSTVPVSQASIDRAATWIRQAQQPGLPVVVADAHSFAVLWRYAEPDVKSRLVYLADSELALKDLGHNSVERGMTDLLKPWFGMNVVPFEPYVAEHPRFLVYGDFVRRAFLNWLVPELQLRGMRVELLQRAGDDMLLLASRGHDRGMDDTADASIARPGPPPTPAAAR